MGRGRVGGGGAARVSEYSLQRIQKKKIFFSFLFVFYLGWGGGGYGRGVVRVV